MIINNYCFITRNKRKLEQAREKLKGEEVTKDKAKEEKSKRELRELEKKVRIFNNNDSSTLIFIVRVLDLPTLRAE